MDPCQQVDQVRELVHTTFLQLGASPNDSIQETLLLDNGFYCGRRFDGGGCQAVWRFDTGRVDFAARGGVFIQTQAPGTPPVFVRRAA